MTLLRRELDAGTMRQRVIANNIANVNTPNFKKSSVRFEETLKRATGDDLPVLTSDPRHIGGPGSDAGMEPVVVKNERTTLRADGNNVDVDQEMSALALNTILYNAATQAINERLALLSYVITGRR
jgi:flagellar basal-body rod protein FlgB